MIQRIQSFYLVLVAVGAVLMFMFPVANFVTYDTTLDCEIRSELNLIPKGYVYPDGVMDSMPTFIGQQGHGPAVWPLTALTALFGIIALVSIFLYKNRVLQMRVVAFGFLANVIHIGLVFLLYVDKYATSLAPEFGGTAPVPHYSVGTWTPIVTAILFFLAQRAIRSDEMKVRAADRIR